VESNLAKAVKEEQAKERAEAGKPHTAPHIEEDNLTERCDQAWCRAMRALLWHLLVADGYNIICVVFRIRLKTESLRLEAPHVAQLPVLSTTHT
jgi:hypothetical protein